MMDAGRHPNITLLTYSEVEDVSGYVGNFKVKVRKKARYVDPDACTGCGICWTECFTRRVPEGKRITLSDMSIGKREAGEP
jgi:heterodisulfide reductase subunit A